MSTRVDESAAHPVRTPRTCIVVTGAGSGLGFAIAKHFESLLSTSVEGRNTTLYCIDRRFPRVHELEKEPADLSNDHTSFRVVHEVLEITDEAALHAFGKRLDVNGDGIHLIVHCAGIRGLSSRITLEKSSDVRKAETLEMMDASTMLSTLSINAVGTFSLMQALAPALMRRSKSERMPRAVILGSRMGSISLNTKDNPSGGAGYAYRTSKAAQNAVVRSLSVDIPSVIWTIIHPGRVETGLVAVREEGAKSVDEVMPMLMQLIDGLTESDSGTYIDIHGNDISW